MEATRVIIESDSNKSIDAINNENSAVDWEVFSLVEDIRNIGSSFQMIYFTAIPRTSNIVADWLSKAFSSLSYRCNWVVNPPEALASLLFADAV